MNRVKRTKLPATNGHSKEVNGGLKQKAVRMYQSAMVNRLTADWIVSITSANAEILVSRKATIARSQELERDNSWMEKILSIYENNVIGHRGVRLQMDVRLKNGKVDKKANEAIEKAWEKFNRQENCCVSRTISGIELEKLVVRAVVRDGGILLRKYRGFSNEFSFSIEPIDIARLDHDYNLPHNGIQNEINFGIEFDRYKCPVAYHVLVRHPGDVFAWRSGPKYRERIPADEIIPVWTTKRAGQFVMMPLLTSIMNRLNILDKYDQAEAVAAFLASCKGGFLEKTGVSDEYKGETDAQGNTITEFQPGMIEELPLNYTFKPNDPTHPTEAYPHFIKGQLRAIASGAGVPYNDLANDLEGVNFSSIRSGMQECREGYKGFQRLLVDKMETPRFESWLKFAILSGQVPYQMGDYDRLNAPCWKPRRWPYIQPVDDVTSTLLAINGGLTSRTAEIADSDSDDDFEEVCEQQEQDEEKAKEHKLTFSTEKPTLKNASESGKDPANPNAAAVTSQ